MDPEMAIAKNIVCIYDGGDRAKRLEKFTLNYLESHLIENDVVNGAAFKYLTDKEASKSSNNNLKKSPSIPRAHFGLLITLQPQSCI